MVNLGVLCGIPLRKQMSMAQIRNQVGHIRFGVWQGTERVAHLLPPGERGEQIEDAIGQGFLQMRPWHCSVATRSSVRTIWA